MSPALDPLRCLRLNEGRQAQAIADLADEHLPLGAGTLGFMQGTDWICKAVGVDLDAPLGDEEVAQIADWFRSRGVPPVLEVTAYAATSTLSAAARAGFALQEVEHVLARPTAALPVELPDGYVIAPLDPEDDAAMRRHAEIVCGGFVPAGHAVPEPVLESAMRSQRHPHARGVFVRDPQGEAVAASGMEITELDPGDGATRLLALWGTTVLPDHRRRGLQQALIAHRLRVGARAGAELAVIESRPGIPTERNAARMGFSLGYTRFVLKAPAAS